MVDERLGLDRGYRNLAAAASPTSKGTQVNVVSWSGSPAKNLSFSPGNRPCAAKEENRVTSIISREESVNQT